MNSKFQRPAADTIAATIEACTEGPTVGNWDMVAATLKAARDLVRRPEVVTDAELKLTTGGVGHYSDGGGGYSDGGGFTSTHQPHG